MKKKNKLKNKMKKKENRAEREHKRGDRVITPPAALEVVITQHPHYLPIFCCVSKVKWGLRGATGQRKQPPERTHDIAVTRPGAYRHVLP